MAELPDDIVEQVRDELGMVLSVGSVRVLRAVYPLIAAHVRAEAVADERQRIAAAIEAEAHRAADAPATPAWPEAFQAGRVNGLVDAKNIAAGSVPVATPRPIEDAATLRDGFRVGDASRDGLAQALSDRCGPVATPTEPVDPTYGRIDPDIQRAVDALEPESIGSRVAMENTLQARRDAASPVPAGQPESDDCDHGGVPDVCCAPRPAVQPEER